MSVSNMCSLHLVGTIARNPTFYTGPRNSYLAIRTISGNESGGTAIIDSVMTGEYAKAYKNILKRGDLVSLRATPYIKQNRRKDGSYSVSVKFLVTNIVRIYSAPKVKLDESLAEAKMIYTLSPAPEIGTWRKEPKK